VNGVAFLLVPLALSVEPNPPPGPRSHPERVHPPPPPTAIGSAAASCVTATGAAALASVRHFGVRSESRVVPLGMSDGGDDGSPDGVGGFPVSTRAATPARMSCTWTHPLVPVTSASTPMPTSMPSDDVTQSVPHTTHGDAVRWQGAIAPAVSVAPRPGRETCTMRHGLHTAQQPAAESRSHGDSRHAKAGSQLEVPLRAVVLGMNAVKGESGGAHWGGVHLTLLSPCNWDPMVATPGKGGGIGGGVGAGVGAGSTCRPCCSWDGEAQAAGFVRVAPPLGRVVLNKDLQVRAGV